MNNVFSKAAIWLVIALVLFTVFKQFDNRSTSSGNSVPYSEFLDDVRNGRIKSVVISDTTGTADISAVTVDDRRIRTTGTYLDRGLVGDLVTYGVKFDVKPREEQSFLMSVFVSWFPMLLLIGVWVFFMRQMQGGGKGGAFSFGKSRARMLDENNNQITFADVAGCDEAKEEVQELVDFLRDPSRFQKLGGRIPRGVLMVGSPGTGKTLLAKAIAGEAKVPFFSISGSDFVEMFVGVGAARVRDMFENAKKQAPCIIFIDEIDAVGRQRGAGLGGGNDEREQTLNQMLVEMDGFETNQGIIVIAATNRPDVLDPALLRPGRFDRQVVVDRPDYAGRLEILNVHARGKTFSKDVDLQKIARRTPGFTGADLSNLLNEAAILAARRNLTEISMDEVNDAIDRVLAGPEKKDRVMSERRKELVAYHEAGHALVGALMPDYDPVQKISIIPRGRAGGLTWFTPSEDRMESGLYSRSYLQNQMAVALGGRIAEEIVFGEEEVTTGASNDLQQVARVARQMVTRFGMSDKLGPVALGRQQGNMFLGRDIAAERDFSESTAAIIDEEVRSLVDEAYHRAKQVLTGNRSILDQLAHMLVDKETVDAEELQQLLLSSDVRMASIA
ncbi:MAG: ATP-dependent zinc metalloprotease FtsH [Betaproteobacteria bacterium]